MLLARQRRSRRQTLPVEPVSCAMVLLPSPTPTAVVEDQIRVRGLLVLLRLPCKASE